MENHIDIVKDIADGMIGIGGIPSNEEFYAEFDMRVREALHIHGVVGRSEQLVCDECKGWGYTVDENGRRKAHCTKCD